MLSGCDESGSERELYTGTRALAFEGASRLFACLAAAHVFICACCVQWLPSVTPALAALFKHEEAAWEHEEEEAAYKS